MWPPWKFLNHPPWKYLNASWKNVTPRKYVNRYHHLPPHPFFIFLVPFLHFSPKKISGGRRSSWTPPPFNVPFINHDCKKFHTRFVSYCLSFSLNELIYWHLGYFEHLTPWGGLYDGESINDVIITPRLMLITPCIIRTLYLLNKLILH